MYVHTCILYACMYMCTYVRMYMCTSADQHVHSGSQFLHVLHEHDELSLVFLHSPPLPLFPPLSLSPSPSTHARFVDFDGTEDAGIGTFIPPQPTQPTSTTSQTNAKLIRPTALTRFMRKREETLENEEEILEEKGGFLQQGWLALNYLQKRVS